MMYFKFHDLEAKTDLRGLFSFQQWMESRFSMLRFDLIIMLLCIELILIKHLKIAKWLTFYFNSRVREGQF